MGTSAALSRRSSAGTLPLGGAAAVTANTTFTTEQIIAALTTSIPAGSLQVGTTIRAKALVSGSAASTTMTMRMRYGTAGTTADTVLFTLALAGGSTPTINSWVFEFLITWRTVGASGVVVPSGWAQCKGTSSTANPFAADAIGAVVTGLDTTVAKLLTVSFQASAGTGAIASATIEIVKP